MRLLKLAIENFKGIKHFEFDPEGRNLMIFGNNGVGKTTLADAYSWLLFGKDSAGRSDSNFDVKTRGTSGLDYTVEGSFEHNGRQFTLRRVYKELWSRKNGEAERELKGNTTEFFIDEVPKAKGEYTTFISKICDEKIFRLLTDPDMFPGKLKWDERRDLLLKYLGIDTMDDLAIISAHPELKDLRSYIGFKKVEDYVEITKAQRKKINDQLALIPSRIDEAEKAKPTELPTEADGMALLRQNKERLKLEDQMQKLRNGEAASSLRKDISDLEAQLAEARSAYLNQSGNVNKDGQIRAQQLRQSISDTDREIRRLKNEISGDEALISYADKQIVKYRNDWNTTNAQEWQGDTVCPTCGRELPADKIDSARDAFNSNKSVKLEQLVAESGRVKAEKAESEESLAANRTVLTTAETKLADLNAQLDKLTASFVTPPAFDTTAQYKTLTAKIDQKRADLQELQNGITRRAGELQAQLNQVNDRIDELKARASNKDIIERQNKRIEELKREERELAGMLATYDNGLLLAEQFTQAKAHDIEEKVNGMFQTVRWKLFETQINGGIKNCCEAMVDGIEYNTNLNSAAKLNAGLDIINVLSRAVGITVPIWIDNAESVTRYIPVDAQVIKLYVSEVDRKLRVEYEDGYLQEAAS